MCLCGYCFAFSGYTKHLEGFRLSYLSKVMVALTGLLDSSEDNLRLF